MLDILASTILLYYAVPIVLILISGFIELCHLLSVKQTFGAEGLNIYVETFLTGVSNMGPSEGMHDYFKDKAPMLIRLIVGMSLWPYGLKRRISRLSAIHMVSVNAVFNELDS